MQSLELVLGNIALFAGVLAPVVLVAIQVLKKLLPFIYGPYWALVSLLSGVAVAVVLAIIAPASFPSLAIAIVSGLVAGVSASGLYDAGTSSDN